MRELILENQTEAEFINLFKPKAKSGGSYEDFIKTLASDGSAADTLISGKTVVFTGTLERMQRKEALALVAQCGGIPANSITKATNILVVGNLEFAASVKGGKSNKIKKAEEYVSLGLDITVISEKTFFDMLEM